MKYIFIIILSFVGIRSFSQVRPYSIHQVDSLIFQSEKKVMILITAPWCNICALMKESCFEDEEIKAYMDDSINFIEFNSELNERVNFNDQSFYFIPNGSTGKNELALQLGMIDNKFILPTTVFMDNSGEIIYQRAGLINSSEMKKIISIIK